MLCLFAIDTRPGYSSLITDTIIHGKRHVGQSDEQAEHVVLSPLPLNRAWLLQGAGSAYTYAGYPGYGTPDASQAYSGYGADPYSAYAAFGGYDAALQVST